MGLTIHYNGRFNPAASLSALIDEVRDIAEINKWKYHVFENEFPPNAIGKTEYNDQIYGICFSLPECEPVWLSFLSNGKMSCPPNLEFWGNSDEPDKKEYLYMLFTKTQYAGIEAHKFIIQLLKYLNEKYLLDFNMTDEGKYWETGDEDLLKEIFGRYTRLIDSFSNALQSIPIKKGENLEDFITRIARGIQDKDDD